MEKGKHGKVTMQQILEEALVPGSEHQQKAEKNRWNTHITIEVPNHCSGVATMLIRPDGTRALQFDSNIPAKELMLDLLFNIIALSEEG
mgnify:CR=1 FL=1